MIFRASFFKYKANISVRCYCINNIKYQFYFSDHILRAVFARYEALDRALNISLNMK